MVLIRGANVYSSRRVLAKQVMNDCKNIVMSFFRHLANTVCLMARFCSRVYTYVVKSQSSLCIVAEGLYEICLVRQRLAPGRRTSSRSTSCTIITARQEPSCGLGVTHIDYKIPNSIKSAFKTSTRRDLDRILNYLLAFLVCLVLIADVP